MGSKVFHRVILSSKSVQDQCNFQFKGIVPPVNFSIRGFVKAWLTLACMGLLYFLALLEGPV